MSRSAKDDEKARRELASESEKLALRQLQDELKGTLARLKARGIEVSGADAALLLNADGATKAQLAELTSTVDGFNRDASGKEMVAVVGDAISMGLSGAGTLATSIVAGGDEVPLTNLFKSLTSGVGGLFSDEKLADKSKDKGSSVA